MTLMILLLGHYRDRNPARAAELRESLRRNCDNSSISEVHLFLEDDTRPDFEHPKLRFLPFGRRVFFQDLFEYANRELPGRRVIIANSDIYFDRSLGRILDFDLCGTLVCLSRWEMQLDGSSYFFEQPWSQDAWIFQAPVPRFRSDWHLGIPGCENRLAHEAAEAGLELLNPGRSVRACHLHLSAVRHYTERQRLRGPGRPVHAGWLGTPWLWIIVPCMGRLADVREHFGTLVAQPRSSCVLVDYACPERSGIWVRENHPGTILAQVRERVAFNAAEARNVGAAATDPDALLCFLDPDVALASDFAASVLPRCHAGTFLIPDEGGPGLDSTLVCWRSDFDRVGGYDQNYLGGAAASADLRAALQRAGLEPRTFSASLLTRREHSPGVLPGFHLPDPALAEEIDAAYGRVKTVVVEEAGPGLSRAALREIRRAITHRQLVARNLLPTAQAAAVTFQESMGYTVAYLQRGVSSHNNDARPFEEIPAPLEGLAFTQVVASRVSPVRVKFRNAGRLYVLVGTDWDGYHPATAFMRLHGYREPLPDVCTRRGTGFEVWSLVGEIGDELELPTQVMLLARELVAA